MRRFGGAASRRTRQHGHTAHSAPAVTEIPPSPAMWSEAGVTAECMPMTGYGRFVAARFFGSGADSAGDAKLRSC
jgi:hypothetical protein